ncbi:hypothetical protein Q1695_011354 [Nippostrongylus brasiliensis]|nr:hypothetical protein Q1695_011354 [Nippostrongylus brasiliensis]
MNVLDVNNLFFESFEAEKKSTPFHVIPFNENSINMQTQAIESTFGQPLPPADPQHIQNRHYAQNAPSNSDTTRSRSRSTEGTDNTEASHSNTAVNEPSVPISQPVQNLGMALQHATLDTQTFPNFNNPDLFSFQPNSLLQYPMLSSFGRNPQMNAVQA